MERIFTYGDWLVEKFISLRGNFYNRIAHFVILSGIFLCVEPFWEPYLTAFIEKKFNIDIQTQSATWLGVILVLLGLTYLYLREKLEKGELSFADLDRKKHDAACLTSLQQASSFEAVRHTLDYIETHDAFFKHHKQPIEKHVAFLDAPENKFLDPKLNRSATNYSNSLKILWDFLILHFFTYPEVKYANIGFQFCLYPDLNPDRAGGHEAGDDRKYAAKQSELDILISNVFQAQKALIEDLKSGLGAGFHSPSTRK
jgi:hypothetical protein